MSVWQQNNLVHLTSAAYKDIACLIQHQAGSLVLGAPASGHRPINSIIPGQPQTRAGPTGAEAAATAPTPTHSNVKMSHEKDRTSEEKVVIFILHFYKCRLYYLPIVYS